MLNFIRKLRRNQPTMNLKYLKYAIGEIMLVVIGILLAVQINQWNTGRINSGKEKAILSQLHAEFLENKMQLENVWNAIDEIIALTSNED